MRVATILDRGRYTPVLGLVALAWILVAIVPMAHEPVAFALGWTAMCSAMMLPTVLGPGQFAASGSARRGLAFAFGYVITWMTTAPLAYTLMHAVTWSTNTLLLASIAVGVYQLTPFVRRALAKCHERRRCSRPTVFGAKQGIACVVSCFPVMVLLMLFLEAAQPPLAVVLLVLVAATIVMALEKLRPRGGRVLGLVMLAVASVALVVGVGVQVGPGGEVTHLDVHEVRVPG